MKKSTKGWIILAATIGVISIVASSGDSSTQTNIVESSYDKSVIVPIVTPSPAQPEQPVQQKKEIQTNPNTLSNDNYYTNINGNKVHSPAYTPDNSVPAGASAQCRDGQYSFSQNRRGTCSSHGGVARWL